MTGHAGTCTRCGTVGPIRVNVAGVTRLCRECAVILGFVKGKRWA